MNSTRVRQIWAIGSGKGGVGKSLVSSTLAINLSRMGFEVIAVDLDLGGANLHTSLGVPIPEKTLGDFFHDKTEELTSCITPTSIPKLQLISGAQDPLFITQTSNSKKTELLNALRTLNADYIILDLGAGTHHSTIQFFLTADVKIVTLLPEPSSIEGAYRFIKTLYYQNLLYSPELSEIHDLIKTGMNPKNSLNLKTPSDLYKEVSNHYPQALPHLRNKLNHFHLNLILNQTRTQNDIEVGDAVRNVCKKYFGVSVECLGNLDYDSLVWQSVRKRKPTVIEYPTSKLALSFELITKKILKLNPYGI